MAAKAKKKSAAKAKPVAKKAPAKAAKKPAAKARGPEISSDLRKVALAHALRRLK
jgi:hypothetical protein